MAHVATPEVVAPTLMRHTLRTEQFTTLTVVYAVPTTPGRCRLMARFPFIFKAALPRFFFKLVPRWWSHLNQNAILEDDQIFLHKQERLVENAAARGDQLLELPRLRVALTFVQD